MTANEKLTKLKEELAKLGRVAIAFSGGVDSSFLLKVAHEVLGDNLLAVTATSAAFPMREKNEAQAFCTKYGISHIIIESEELDIDGFSHNPVNRCYLCKKELFEKIKQVAKAYDILHVAEASNADDLGDYRPGLLAIAELDILSPLVEVKLTKDEIRLLSKEMGLATWDKPSFACLSSRFPYGQEITREKLAMIDKAEQFLLDEGFSQVRVRHHGDVARIELHPTEIARLWQDNMAQKVYDYFKKLGFIFTAVDLKGYRTGSMNENL